MSLLHKKRSEARIVSADGRDLGSAGAEVHCGHVFRCWGAWTGWTLGAETTLCHRCFEKDEQPVAYEAIFEHGD